MVVSKALLSSMALILGAAPAIAGELPAAPRPQAPIGADSAGMFYVTYPRGSVARGEQGSVHYRVTIDRGGRPLDCVVTRSSGYPRLDNRTCLAVINHTRFVLPPNPGGSPIKPTYEGQVDWRLR